VSIVSTAIPVVPARNVRRVVWAGVMRVNVLVQLTDRPA
jgi:hypothetical protein